MNVVIQFTTINYLEKLPVAGYADTNEPKIFPMPEKTRDIPFKSRRVCPLIKCIS